MKLYAFGPLRLQPVEFWRLTLRELNEMIAADREYYHLQMEMYAQHAAWVLTPNAKKGSVIKATDLYKRPGHKAVRKLTLKERFDYGRDDGSTR